MKVEVFCPAAIVTEAGTVAAALLLFSVITVPPGAAGLERVTVPTEFDPPCTAVGLSVNVEIDGGLIVNVVFTVPPLRLALMVAAA